MTHHPNLTDFNNKRSADAARKREAGKTTKELGWTVWPTATEFLKHQELVRQGGFETTARKPECEEKETIITRIIRFFTNR